jgi:hypothetical protein
MASTCAVPIKGKIVRVVAVDQCGVPITGAGTRVVVSKSFTQVQMQPQYEDGTEFFERTADGSLCVNQKDAPTLKRMLLSVDLCSVDPDMTPMVLAARELTTTGPVSGTGFAMMEGTPTNRFSLECWQQVAGSGACDPTGLQRYIYNAWPNAGNARLQDYTIQNDKSVLSFQCETQAAAAQWGDGPGSGATWLPAGAGGLVGPTDHWLWNITTVAPPVDQCGFFALT